MAADLAVLAEEKSQPVVVEAQGSAHTLGDRVMVRQALINLVDNAIKFRPPGGRIVIRVSSRTAKRLSMSMDNGPGIPAAVRERIFDRFFRAPSHVRRCRRHAGSVCRLRDRRWKPMAER